MSGFSDVEFRASGLWVSGLSGLGHPQITWAWGLVA